MIKIPQKLLIRLQKSLITFSPRDILFSNLCPLGKRIEILETDINGKVK